MQDIKEYADFTKIEPVNKGWSTDKKYYVETKHNKRLLLRIADISEYEVKKSEYEMVAKLCDIGVPASVPVDFGICEGGKSVYSLFNWCIGEDSAEVLPELTLKEQYTLGIKAGKILKLIHTIPAPENIEKWHIRENLKIDRRIRRYLDCGIKAAGENELLKYVAEHRFMLNDRPQCFLHGDYHVGNMIVAPDYSLSIIDFNRMCYGDAWEDFRSIVWSADNSPYFATGQIYGYFDNNVPENFFKLLALYIAVSALFSIPWATHFGEAEVKKMLEQSDKVISWYSNMSSYVPSWYIKDAARSLF